MRHELRATRRPAPLRARLPKKIAGSGVGYRSGSVRTKWLRQHRERRGRGRLGGFLQAKAEEIALASELGGQAVE